jgi:hypothetical protein
MKRNPIFITALVLVIIGGLNWGLVAFGFNLVDALFGAIPIIERIIYLLVGLSALYLAIEAPRSIK